VYRSGFLLRLLGVWLFINVLAYLILSSTRLLWPQRYKATLSSSERWRSCFGC
jgi:hypothetical protein